MNGKPPLGPHVFSDVSSVRVARIWERVSEQLATRGRLRSPWFARLVSVGVVFACLAIGWLGFTQLRSGAGSSTEKATLATTNTARALDLEDGSRLQLAAYTRVEVSRRTPQATELRLTQGRVECDVVPDKQRRFSVLANGVEVRVTGTRFSVELIPADDRVSVEVQRGSVEVRPPHGAGLPRRLVAGERWSGGIRPSTSKAPVLAPLQPQVDRALAPGSPATPPSEALPADSPRTPSEAARGARVGSSPHNDPRPSPSLQSKSARELLDHANAARRSGNIGEAASAYELLLATHPGDARAGLAAFELGRLRMDRLGNLAGAVQALRQAAALAKDAGIREDAMARLVRAFDAMGAHERCREAQTAYIKSFPAGVHATAVSTHCRALDAPSPRR